MSSSQEMISATLSSSLFLSSPELGELALVEGGLKPVGVGLDAVLAINSASLGEQHCLRHSECTIQSTSSYKLPLDVP